MVKSEHKGDSSHPRHIYIALGFMAFASVVPARGSMFTAAHRSNQNEKLEMVVSEKDLYDK